MNKSPNVVSALASSALYQEYERAFTEATGLPLALRSVESWHLPLRRKRNENPFCATMAQKSATCAGCLQVQQKLSEAATDGAQTITCEHGLCDTAVPVHLGKQLIGFLQTGQVFLRKPSFAQFEKSYKIAANGGPAPDRAALQEIYFNTPVLTQKQYDSMIKLLSLFAEHLSILSNQLVVQKQNSEPPVITRAKEFIEQNYEEDMSLGQVAQAVNTSAFYFCKMFKHATGVNFTEYLARIRVEKAKNLLLNPNLRISEIAFAVGFQSLTHFNRVFKKLLGQSPTEYRIHLPHPTLAA
jgi:AraC-like DNA-binding protein/ligand-binding sensor protein